MRAGVIAEALDESMTLENLLDDPALHPPAAAVHQSHVTAAPDFEWLEQVQPLLFRTGE